MALKLQFGRQISHTTTCMRLSLHALQEGLANPFPMSLTSSQALLHRSQAIHLHMVRHAASWLHVLHASNMQYATALVHADAYADIYAGIWVLV